MLEEKRRIHSPSLLGITIDHDYHRGSAPMHSTGDLVQVRGEETEARNWFMEFKCEVCGELILEWNAQFHDLARDALKKAGIIQLDGA